MRQQQENAMDESKVLFIRPSEAATRLGISRSKLYELLRAGIVPSRKFGASIRVPVEALERMAREAAEVAAPVAD
jgi:excisionase family DNA binding protein